ncbi:class I SAM-dependent methyltransferase [Modestobacter lapidis]|nr:class I SAM-dependent methyltransferase [Modestobacter lapidis]
MTVDMARVEQFANQVIGDIAAAEAGVLSYVGDRLGLYRAMAGAGPLTLAELADRTTTHPRYLQEWLAAQAAGGYVTYQPGGNGGGGTFTLPDEHAAVLADDASPVFLAGAFGMAASSWADADVTADALRTGAGIGWGDHDPRLYPATERFFRTGYAASLTSEWIPALDGVEDKLVRGAQVADVGCGHGASTTIMARAFPASSFAGFDVHDASIDAARTAAATAGLSDQVRFDVATADAIPAPAGGGYDLVCFFDCLHDMGDPVAAARRACAVLAEGGTVLLVEPRAGDRLEDNLHPLGRLMYAASTQLCTPNAVAQGGETVPGGRTLGGQAGEARLTEVLHEAGFGRVRRAAETPFTMVLEARP